MFTNIFKDIRSFHAKFGVNKYPIPGELDEKFLELRNILLEEEYNEYKQALKDHDLEEQIDALIDIIYVCAGTLNIMGVKSEKHWKEVHKANMKKKLVDQEFLSKRGILGDFYKPDGWIPPNHKKYL